MVLTDIRGSREVARDQREALMVPRGAPALLAEAILRLVTDDDLRVRLGDAARVRALERFDERRVHDVLLAEYRRLLERKGLVGHPVTLEGFGRVTIRAARPGEVGWMADLHARTHPQAFLPSLGRRFLELLYRAHIEEPVAVALVAEQDGRPIGYTTGLLSTARFRRRFALRHGLGAALAAAPALTRPGVLRGVMDLAGYPEKVGDLPQAEWTFIALDPDVRARGLGTLLGRSVLRALATQGADRVKTFVAADNEPSNRMVLRLGFEPRGNLSIHDGVPSNLYVLTCPFS
jgi:GNAT superfamily N-acetyltransferase